MKRWVVEKIIFTKLLIIMLSWYCTSWYLR